MRTEWRFVAMAVALASAGASEPSEPSRELATKLLDLMQIRPMMEQQFASMRQAQLATFQQLTRSQDTSPEAIEHAEAVQSEMMALMKEGLTWDSMEAEFTTLYASTFTDDELRGLIAFYESPTGRALVAKTPTLTRRAVEISSARVQAILPKLQELLLQRLQQIPAASDERN